jgi:CubicO group peptidase (beta-lactamase class C family)
MNPSSFPRTSPEAQGIPSAAIADFVTRASQTIQHLHSIMLLRHGAVVAEGWWLPYRPAERHMLFSLSKSFTSTAIGLAVAEGRLSVDDPVLKFFPQDVTRKVSPNLAAMKVHHLLAMSTGHDQDITDASLRSRNPFKAFLAQPVAHPPGSHFVYNTAASFMLSAILQKLTGQTLVEYLAPRLFEPLGIQDVFWDSHPIGVNFGGFGLYLTTEEIARFGQLYLQQGRWKGKQLVPADWVAEATRKHTDNGSDPASDWEQGYAYQFWRCRPSGVYRGDGAFGQYCVIMPEQDAVLAITGGMAEMQPLLSLAWEKLLPGMLPGALPANPAAQRTLAHTLASLVIHPPHSDIASPLEADLSGKTCTFPPNPLTLHSFSLDFAANSLTYRLLGGGVQRGKHSLPFGRSAWVEGQFLLGTGHRDMPLPPAVTASGRWKTADTFELTICHYQTPFIATLSFTFTAGQVSLQYQRNVSFIPQDLPPLVGVCSS